MRKRMIDPNIWTNRHFIKMSSTQQLLFISLISHSDDHGRLWNDTVSIKSYTFPSKNIAHRAINSSLKLFSEMGLISIDDISIQLLGWKQYQYVPKPQQSQIPEPNRYRTITEPLPNQYGSDTEPLPNQYGNDTEAISNQSSSDIEPIPPKGKKKEIIDKESNAISQRQRDNGCSGNSFEAETMMKDVIKLFEENKFKLSHSQYNEVKSLIDKERHLSAQIKLFKYLNLAK